MGYAAAAGTVHEAAIHPDSVPFFDDAAAKARMDDTIPDTCQSF
jgi:hypothetical protein